jgi:NADH dehydrogenase
MQPHVVIVGGGFGGLYAARELARHPVRVTLVDRSNHHLFQPLLYQVATAALSPGDIAQPIRSILRKARNVDVVLGDVKRIDPAARRVVLEDGELGYDYLVLAPGSRHAYFGHDEWEPLAPGLKSLDDALEIRRRILNAYEAAERIALEARDSGRPLGPDEIRAMLTFVIVGGGPTGVELAGAIAEIGRLTLAREFHAIDPAETRVLLVEGAPRILATFPETLSRKALAALERLGVEVRAGAVVTDVGAWGARIGDELVKARTILWAAGVAASPLGRDLDAPLDRTGRVLVEPDLSVPGRRELFVVGDLASFAHGLERPLPGTAAVAYQQGLWAGANIGRDLAGVARRPFKYRHQGSLAIIGRGHGVADFGVFRLAGYSAWLAWLFIHIYLLIGFEHRLLVMLQWAWAYWSRGSRTARLITAGAAGSPSGRAGPTAAAPGRKVDAA